MLRESAALYIQRGWNVVPLEPKGKKCVDSDWLSRVYSPEDFKPTQNIGIKSQGGLVDVDCDCAEAVFMAEVFLPRTQAVYGRASRPKSHWLFRCPTIKDPLAFKDLISKKMLLELRVNHQSMAPPSMHPDGEQVSWHTDGAELVVDEALLVRQLRLDATGCMLARYYNAPGDRHDWGLAVAGLFRRIGITKTEADQLFERAARWAKDDKVKDRLDAVRTTYSQPEDAAQTAGTKLAELMPHGKEWVTSIMRFWGAAGASKTGIAQTLMDKLNATHAVVFDQAGHLTVLTETQHDGLLQVRTTDPGQMALLYPQPVQVGTNAAGAAIMKPLGKAWLDDDKRRRFYRGIELAPPGAVPNDGYYNLWQGFSVEPKQGDYPLFQEQVRTIARGDAASIRYIFGWMADCVQRPHRPGGVALAIKGGQGTGKSTFGRWFGSLFGAHFLHLDSDRALLGHFNAHLHNALVVLADEAVWAGGKQGLGALKRMITEQTLSIERKGVDIINVRNMLHMIIASNEEWVVPSSFDQRRFAVFEMGNDHQNDWRFFQGVHDELFQRGGLAALLHDLLAFDLNGFEVRDIPKTDEDKEQKIVSMSGRDAWWYEQLTEGTIWANAQKVHPEYYHHGNRYIEAYQVDGDVIYESFVKHLRTSGHYHERPVPKNVLSRWLGKLMPGPFPKSVQFSDGTRTWLFPPLDVCREEWEHATKTPWKWPGADDTIEQVMPDHIKTDVPF